MKVHVLLPMYRHMEAPAVTSLAALLLNFANNGINVMFSHSNGADIARARNGLVKSVRECDYVLMIDSDMTYTYNDFDTLVRRMDENNLDMLSAKYFTRNILVKTRKLAMLNWSEEAQDYVKIEAKEEKGLQECDVVGLGFCVVKYKLIKHLQDTLTEKMFSWGKYGEDATFCKHVKNTGRKIYYDADTIVGHLTQVVNK